MKVLYIGHYKEGSGWSQAAQDYILALDSVGVDVVPRPVKLHNNWPEIPERITELEQKSSKGAGICIQHVLPHFMDFNGGFKKNIGLFVTETSSIKYSGWPSRLNTMDELWVPNNEMVDVCINSDVKNIPVKIVPHAANMERFDTIVKQLDIPEAKGKFVFYFIGEYNRRKRMSALIQAYIKTFSIHDDVLLVLKTNKPDMDAEELAQVVANEVQTLQEHSRKFSNSNMHAPVSIVTNRLSDEEIMQLHTLGDCFVVSSFGEAWCIPAFDAMAMGNLVVSSDIGGMRDFLENNGLMVDGQLEPVINPDAIFDDMLTCREEWFQCSVSHLAEQMNTAFTMSKKERKVITTLGKKQAKKYSYKVIGNKMKELLND